MKIIVSTSSSSWPVVLLAALAVPVVVLAVPSSSSITEEDDIMLHKGAAAAAAAAGSKKNLRVARQLTGGGGAASSAAAWIVDGASDSSKEDKEAEEGRREEGRQLWLTGAAAYYCFPKCDASQGMVCLKQTSSLFPTCTFVEVSTGGDCQADIQCVDSKGLEECVDGTCLLVPKDLGDPCEDTIQCVDNNLHCLQGVCTVPKDLGDSCENDEECVAAPSLKCRPDEDDNNNGEVCTFVVPCFETTEQVHKAVDLYTERRNNPVYGNNLCEWCFAPTVTSLAGLFWRKFYSFNEDISCWDVSGITDFRIMFAQAHAFNQDLSAWDVSNGLYFDRMFERATAFNGNISNWNVENGISFSEMFLQAESFNQDLSSWDLGFNYDDGFNQDMFSKNTHDMFKDATAFLADPHYLSRLPIGVDILARRDVGDPCTMNEECVATPYPNGEQCLPDPWSSRDLKCADAPDVQCLPSDNDPNSSMECTVVPYCFETYEQALVSAKTYTIGENVPIYGNTLCDWCFGPTVTSLERLFDPSLLLEGVPPERKNFTEDISCWDVSGITNFRNMFSGAVSFNQDIGTWNVERGIIFEGMFSDTEAFNQDLSSWNLGTNPGVITWRMFMYATAFDQDLSSWNVSNAKLRHSDMFLGATAFLENPANRSRVPFGYDLTQDIGW